jgi:predicted TIM-barrel fold metal-dependent hydrolase
MVNGYSVTDMQHHFIPEAALNLFTQTPEHDYTTGLRRYRRAYAIMADVGGHLEFMDEAGIDTAVLSTGAFTPNGREFCKVVNDFYADLVGKHPGRFIGMIHVFPLDDLAKNLEEIERAADLGLWGLSLVTSYWQTTIDSPVMEPYFEAARKYSMPVFIHPSVRISLWGGEKYDMYTTVSREYDVAKALVELIYGVLPKFPGLKVIVAHLGGGLPALKGRLLAWHQPEGFPMPEEDRRHGLSVHYAQELGLVEDFERRFDNVLLDSAGYGGWVPVMESAFRTVGPDHLCYATDFPYELNRASHARRFVTDVEGFAISAEDKKKFFSENVRKFFSKK